MGFWGWTMTAGFWALVIVLVIWAMRSATTATAQSQARGGNALQTLDERLARGDIDPDEYNERRALVETRR
jgi:putative membrane protein